MTDLTNIRLFATTAHPCGYLDDRDATTIFIDPDADIDRALYSQLTELGFRRSGKHVYRPGCKDCQACIAIRLPVNAFRPNRSQKRCLKKNADLTVVLADTIDTDEHYDLYRRYINLRHKDGDMYPPDQAEYQTFLSPQWGVTRYLEFRDPQGTLKGVAVSDLLEQGLSAVYTFFDPEDQKRSLGVYGILAQIQWARQQRLPFLYMGYWIDSCRKMEYKVNYRPYQLLRGDHWVTYE